MVTRNGSTRTRRHATANRTVTGRLSKQAKAVTQDLHEMGDIAKDAAQEKLEQLRANASEYVEQGRDKVQKVERSIEQYIRERPLKSLLIAAGIGLFLGRFWMRR